MDFAYSSLFFFWPPKLNFSQASATSVGRRLGPHSEHY